MPTIHKLLLPLLFTFFFTSSFQHECIHDQLEHDIKIADEAYTLYPNDKTDGTRKLQNYRSIKILFDNSTMTGASANFTQYISGNLMPAIMNYFEAALQVPVPSANLKAGGYQTLCSGDITVPSIYNDVGVDADLVVFLRAKNDPSLSYVASATACLLESSTKRPVFGKITFNTARISASSTLAQREKNIMTTLHEFTHALGFSGSLFRYFVNPVTGRTLTGHIKTKTVLGTSITAIDVAPLTSRLKAHFNCSTIDGAYLEDEGGSGSAGSHFERRIFGNEYMTASAIIDLRVTEFSLAMLEGSGWYKVDYSMAEPMTYGKNTGCNFLNGDCVNKQTKQANFKEFCTPMNQITCSWTGRAGSICGNYQNTKSASLSSALDWFGDGTVSGDVFADNCPTRLPYTDLDCEDTGAGASPTISGEFYGFGSKCFIGTLYSRGALSAPYPYCFRSTCLDNGNGGYNVEVKVGSAKVNCTQAGQISVPGYSGYLSCPDPQQFCYQALNEGFCRRKCSGKGTCVDRVCVCDAGWGGDDCSLSTELLEEIGYNDMVISDISDSNSNEDSKNKMMIPIIVAAVVGIIFIVIIFFMIKYSKTLFKAIKGLRKIKTEEVKVINNRVAEVQKHANFQTDQNITPASVSPDFTSREREATDVTKNISVYSLDSPIIVDQASPCKTKLYNPSKFSRFNVNTSQHNMFTVDSPQKDLSPQKNLEIIIEPVEQDVPAFDLEKNLTPVMGDQETVKPTDNNATSLDLDKEKDKEGTKTASKNTVSLVIDKESASIPSSKLISLDLESKTLSKKSVDIGQVIEINPQEVKISSNPTVQN